MSGRWRDAWRQRRQHRAFRIAEPRWDAETRRRLRALADRAAATTGRAELPESELARAATSLWQARRTFGRASDPASRDHRQITRYLAAVDAALAEAGVTVQDHDGAAFDAGYRLDVVAYVTDPGVRAETVQDTVRPSVYLHGRLIQTGRVIVGRPAGTEQDTPAEGNHARHR